MNNKKTFMNNKKMKTVLLLAALMTGGTSAWADPVDLTARTANGELFYTSHASGLTYGGTVDVKVGSASEYGWLMNNNIDKRSVGCTLTSSLVEGDEIVVDFYADNAGYTDIFKLYTSNTEGSGAVATMTMASKPTKGEVNTVSYTIPSGNSLIGKTTFYVGKGVQNQYVQKVVIKRSGADDLRPNTLSDNQTWSFDSFNDVTTSENLVNDDLYYFSGAKLETVSDKTALLLTKSNTIKFVVPAGTGKVEAMFLSSKGADRSLKYKIGTNDAVAAGTTASTTGITMTFGYNVTKETEITLFSDNNARAYAYSISVTLSQETLTMNANGYATYSCVNDINVDDITTTLGTVTAYRAATCGDGKVTLEPVTGKVPAGTGLVLKATAGAILTIPYTTGASELDETNLLKAVKQSGSVTSSAGPDGTATSGTNYVLSVQSEKVVFAPIGATAADIKAGQAFLNAPAAGAGARALSLSFGDDEATAVSSVAVSQQPTGIYDLQGRRVTDIHNGLGSDRLACPRSPYRKGLYIKDGKKVMVK